MYVIDASIYAPLIITYGRDLIEKLRKIKSVILDPLQTAKQSKHYHDASIHIVPRI